MPRPILLIFFALTLLSLSLPATAWDYTIRISTDSAGTQGNSFSHSPSISADGRYVAFVSNSVNLIGTDTNGVEDVFVHDRVTGRTRLVSRDSDGGQGNSYSYSPSVSANGRYIAFYSKASDLVAGDTNGVPDIFIHDRTTGDTTRISVATSGAQSNGSSDLPSISGDGRFVAFFSLATTLITGDTNNVADIFVRDRTAGQTTRVSVATGGAQANGYSDSPSISANGRYVAFASSAPDLVEGDTNGVTDIFVHDRSDGWTIRISTPPPGAESDGGSHNPAIAADGQFVAFQSSATNLVEGDTNGVTDVFLYDRSTSLTTRVSVASGGTQGNGDSMWPSISGDGRLIAFGSEATTLVTGDTNDATDVFVHDRITRQTTRVSVATGGLQGDRASFSPSISGSGQQIAFYSLSRNLVPGDTNMEEDVFVHSYPLRFFSVFRPSAYANWIISVNPPTVMMRSHYGVESDLPLVADLNDDGVMDRAVFRGGDWIVDYSMDGSVNWRPWFGMAGDVPLAGFFNRDRFTDRAVFRDGEWIVDYSMDGSVDSRTWYGVADDIPLIADFNNDGNPDRAVFRSGQWIIDYNRDGTVDSRTWYGIAGDIPLAGDFNCDGVMDRAVFRNGQWIFDYSMDGSVDWRPRFGTAGDIPLMWWQG